MPAVTECPSCGMKMRLRERTAARAVRCPGCNTSFHVDDSGGVPTAISSRPLPPRPKTPPVQAEDDYDDDFDDDRPGKRRRDRSAGAALFGLALGFVALGVALPALALSWVPGVNLLGLACSLLGLVLAFMGAILAVVRQRYGMMIAPLAGGLLNLLALLVIGVILATGGVIPDTTTPGRPAEGWGEAIDPDGDCAIHPMPGRLVIKVPATAHDLSAELGQVNAPRVLQNVTGDFTAQVKVSGTFQPIPPSSIPGRVPYNGAGLLLWQDANNYLRLERAALNREGMLQTYAALELRAGGQPVNPQTMPLADADTYLRLERRGNTVSGSVSQDGRQWCPFLPVAVSFPQQARVGVAAISSSAEPFTVQFEQLQVTKPGGAAR